MYTMRICMQIHLMPKKYFYHNVFQLQNFLWHNKIRNCIFDSVSETGLQIRLTICFNDVCGMPFCKNMFWYNII